MEKIVKWIKKLRLHPGLRASQQCSQKRLLRDPGKLLLQKSAFYYFNEDIFTGKLRDYKYWFKMKRNIRFLIRTYLLMRRWSAFHSKFLQSNTSWSQREWQLHRPIKSVDHWHTRLWLVNKLKRRGSKRRRVFWSV